MIHIPNPEFGSELNTLILELERLRTKDLRGEITSHIFFN